MATFSATNPTVVNESLERIPDEVLNAVDFRLVMAEFLTKGPVLVITLATLMEEIFHKGLSQDELDAHQQWLNFEPLYCTKGWMCTYHTPVPGQEVFAPYYTFVKQNAE